ncbi:YchJ family protein [Streptomyces sp. H27-D2]|uniref:YchJ family protein n=1 Tax=Streptomyces sp. H27-D2 TaxID=3046304 RepID=UPI002DBEAA3C|nr:YchJ family metal-binding protein [Streptomyces sp. H27-D2]MEC4019354.1 YchJ family metal-binding protein [Streptomyces sp. H27-D2]
MSRNNARPPTAISPTSPCPCGLDGSPFRDCCGSLHSGRTTASTAERLMRSRFSAFAVRDAAYLLKTWHPTTRPSSLQLDPEQLWTRLDILATTEGSPFHTEGTVEFRAHFSVRGRADSQHEHSRFLRDNGQWVYLSPV